MTQQQTLGRYEIIEEIGSGGFAAVFRARDASLDREVAVKIMRPLLMSDAGFVARFQREAQVAANLEHPHIVPIYDFGEDNGRLYLVMKLVREGSLEKRLAAGPLPFAQVLTIAGQIATALDYAHQEQVIHRDIKPDNVLLGRNDHVYLADFGLVKALEQSSLTASLSGGVLGTPAYVPPEIWHGQDATPQADIYALACLLFEMVSGRPLFQAVTPPATMLLHFSEPRFPDEWPDGVPPGFADALRRGLAQDPADRYASASEMVQALTTLTEIDPLEEPYAVLQASIQTGQWDQAISQAEDILTQNSEYRDIQGLLAQALAGKTQAEQAVWLNIWREQAKTAVQQANWPLAQKALARWQELEPDSPEALALLEQAQSAISPPTTVPDFPGTSTQSQLQEAATIDEFPLSDACPEMTTPEPAMVDPSDIELSNITSGKDPGHLDRPFTTAGSLPFIPGEDREEHTTQPVEYYAKAIADKTGAIELDSKRADLYYSRGIDYHQAAYYKRQSGDYPKAIADFSRAIELDPERADFYDWRGSSYRNAAYHNHPVGDYAKAIADHSRAIELDPKRVNFYHRRGISYHQAANTNHPAGDYAKAIADKARAIELEPDHADFYHSRGISYHVAANNNHPAGDYAKAIADYTRAIELDPKCADFYFERGKCYHTAASINHPDGDYAKAIADKTRAIELDPKRADFYYSRGLSYKISHNQAAAKADFARAADMGHTEAQKELRK